jgi:hypothetical protein
MNNRTSGRVVSRPLELSHSVSAVAMRGFLLAVVLSGCASTPAEPVTERLDPDTATTVTILTRPIELLSQTKHDRQNMDPFAYIAPFETNRMGARDLFLWVSTPQATGTLTPPQVLCNGQPLNLEPLSREAAEQVASAAALGPGRNVSPGPTPDAPIKVDLAQLSLSRAPYDAPVPWSTQWYFRLPADSLKCLVDANGIALQAKAADGDPDQFTTNERKNLASLDAFTRR